MIKVRSTLPEFVHNIIISDSDYFDIEPGGIGNRIFKYYLDKKIISINFERETTKILQFNLDKYNDDIFMDELKRREFQTISDFIRSLFINYVNNLRTTREKIIFQDIFSPIENARYIVYDMDKIKECITFIINSTINMLKNKSNKKKKISELFD